MDSKVAAVMVKPTIGLDVQSWSYDKFMSSSSSHDVRDGAKVTLLEIHPVRPWILSCDKDGEIYLWNYDTNALLMRKTLHEMYATVGREDSALPNSNQGSSRGASGPSGLGTSSDTFCHTGISKGRARNGVNDVNVNRMHTRRSKGFKPSSVSQDILNMSLAISANQENHIDNNDHSNTKKSKDNKLTFGDVRQLGFADRLAISHQCEVNSGANIPVDDDTFNSDSHIMIVCDLAVILYDFVLDTAVTLSVEKSDASKSPKCATFLYKNICAIGFGDGQIRVWSFQSNTFTGSKMKELSGLSGHHREIVLLKTLPVPESSRTRTDTESTIRLLSICIDGVALIWDFSLSGGEFDMKHFLSHTSPTARLQESVGALSYGTAGSGTGSLMLLDAFMDCDTCTLLTVAGDRSFRLWDIGLLSHYQSTSNTSSSNNNNSNSDSNSSSASSDVRGGIRSSNPTISSAHTTDTKKNSFFKFSSPRKGKPESSHSRPQKGVPATSTLPGVCSIPCVGRITPGNSLPPSLMKFVSCCVLNHPRYPFGTFAVVSKTNSIGIAQVTDGSNPTESSVAMMQWERSSVNSSLQDKPQKFQVLNEISLSVLMHTFLSRSSSAGLPPSHSAMLTLAALDGGAKIYCVRSHPTQPHLLAIGTSIGTIVLSLLPSQYGPFIGTHPLWGDMTLSFGDRILRKALVNMTYENQSESDVVRGSRDSLDSGSTEEGIAIGAGPGTWILGKERNRREICIRDASVDVEMLDEFPLLSSEKNTILSSTTAESSKTAPKLGGLFTRKQSFTLEQEKEKKFNLGFKMGFGMKKGEGLKAAVTDAGSSSSGGGDRNKYKSGYVESAGVMYPIDARPPPNLVCHAINISTSRPLFYPSPSGEYCAVLWPESSFYLLFKVKILRRSQTNKKKGGTGGKKNEFQSMMSIDENQLEDKDHRTHLGPTGNEKEGDEELESDSFFEVDRGRAISFGWLGTGSTYAVLAPGYRLETIDQKRSGIFSKNEKDVGLFVSPQLTFKVITTSDTVPTAVGPHDELSTPGLHSVPVSFPIIVDVSVLDVLSTSSSSSSASILPQELFGGLLLCISTPLRSTLYNNDPKSARNAQKSISKIEADALAQQQIDNKKEQMEKERAELGGKMSRSSAASVESVASASAIALEESAGGGGEYFRSTQKSRFYILSSTSTSSSSHRSGNPSSSTTATTAAAMAAGSTSGKSTDLGSDSGKNFALKEVGPSLAGVRSVTWDLTSGLCVVLIGSTVNILRLGVEMQGIVVKGEDSMKSGRKGDGKKVKETGLVGSNVTLSMFASIDLLAYTSSYSSITSSSLLLPSASFTWKNGQLFVLTNTELLLICTNYPYAEKHNIEEVKENDAKDAYVESPCPRLNIFIVASSGADVTSSSADGTMRSLNAYIDRDKVKEKDKGKDIIRRASMKDWVRDRNQEIIGAFTTVQPLKGSHGPRDIVGCRRGHLLLSSRDGNFSATSLTVNPLVAIGSLLSLAPPNPSLPLPLVIAWAAPANLDPLGMTSTAAKMLAGR